MDNEVDKGQVEHRILAENEITIQFLKNKFKIPTTPLVQASQLTKLKKEKELLSQDLNDCK